MAQMKNSTLLLLGLVIVAALIAAPFLQQKLGFSQAAVSAPSGQAASGAQPYISTGATTLNFVLTDAQAQGTLVTATPYIAIGSDNAYRTGISSASPNDVLNVLFVNNSGYHNAFVKGLTVKATPSQTESVSMNRNGSVALSLYNTDNSKMSATVNQTVVTGGAYNMEVRFDGTDKVNTQDMKCILEASDSTKMDKLSLSGAGATFVGQAKPSAYTLSGVNSAVWVYDVQPIVNAVTVKGTLSASSKTGQSLAGTTAKVTCYTKEYFIDSQSGKVSYDIEDSQGNLKSIATYSVTANFQ